MPREKTIDDLKLLYDIYTFRTLTVDQIRNLYFQGRTGYVYSKLHQMKRAGDLDSTAHVVDGKKKDACYYITEKGIRRLINAGYITEARRAYDNKPRGRQIPYLVHANSIHAQLSPYSFEQIDSRAWKDRYNMNRNCMVAAGLKFPNGNEYGVYIFQHSIHEKVYKKWQSEVSSSWQSGKLFVFFSNEEYWDSFLSFLNANALSMLELNLLPFGFGKRLLPYLHNDRHLTTFYKQFIGGQVKPLEDDEKPPFSKYEHLDEKNESSFIVNHLYGDEIAIHLLESKYHKRIYDMIGKKVKLICWGFNEQRLVEKFENYPYVEIISITCETFNQFINNSNC